MLKVMLKKNGSTAEMLLTGRIDANTTVELEKGLLEQAKQFETIILDFSNVTYISSAGLRTLRILHKQMRSKCGTLLIRNVRKDVLDIFQVTGFIGVLNIEGVTVS